MRRLSLLLVLAFCTDLGATEIYKWTDDKGKVHYSDRPPPKGHAFERREVAPVPDSAADEAPAAPQSPECALATKNLGILESNPVVLMDTNGDGEPERLEGDSLMERIALTRQQVQRLCAAPSSPDDASDEEQQN